MANDCLNKLVGLKSLCEVDTQPLFYLDDIEGMNQERLSRLASAAVGTGAKLATQTNESSIRLMLADIDSLIPSNFKVKQELISMCSSCAFSGFFQNAASGGTGISIRNMSNSKHSSIIIDSLKLKINNTGSFQFFIESTNGVLRTITTDFVAGEELTITGLNYETADKQVKIYFTDPSVLLYTVTCPTTSSCGCGGLPKTIETDIIIGGYMNGLEGVTQYGILPCVKIKCSYDSVICDLVGASPRLFGLALLYLNASKVFEENVLTERNNRTASSDKDEKESLSSYYYSLYRERLTGNPKKQILGIAGIINNNLKLIKDKCVSCDNPFGIAWAVS